MYITGTTCKHFINEFQILLSYFQTQYLWNCSKLVTLAISFISWKVNPGYLYPCPRDTCHVGLGDIRVSDTACNWHQVLLWTWCLFAHRLVAVLASCLEVVLRKYEHISCFYLVDIVEEASFWELKPFLEKSKWMCSLSRNWTRRKTGLYIKTTPNSPFWKQQLRFLLSHGTDGEHVRTDINMSEKEISCASKTPGCENPRTQHLVTHKRCFLAVNYKSTPSFHMPGLQQVHGKHTGWGNQGWLAKLFAPK